MWQIRVCRGRRYRVEKRLSSHRHASNATPGRRLGKVRLRRHTSCALGRCNSRFVGKLRARIKVLGRFKSVTLRLRKEFSRPLRLLGFGSADSYSRQRPAACASRASAARASCHGASGPAVDPPPGSRPLPRLGRAAARHQCHLRNASCLQDVTALDGMASACDASCPSRQFEATGET